MLGEKRLGERGQVADALVVRVGPPGGELDGVRGLLLATPATLGLRDTASTGGVGVVLRVGAVGDHEELDVLEQAGVGPEGLPLVAIDLVERLLQCDPAALEFDVHQRQAVDQNRHVVPVLPFDTAPFANGLVLVDHLESVVVDVGLVDQPDVLAGAVVAEQDLDRVLLDASGLLDDPLVLRGDLLAEEAPPFVVGERDVVQQFQLPAQVRLKVGGGRDLQTLVRLRLQTPDELPLQRRLGLVALRTRRVWHIRRNDRRLVGDGDRLVAEGRVGRLGHAASSKVRSLSR